MGGPTQKSPVIELQQRGSPAAGEAGGEGLLSLGVWAELGNGADEEGKIELDLEEKANFPDKKQGEGEDSRSQEGGVNGQPGWGAAIASFGQSVA